MVAKEIYKTKKEIIMNDTTPKVTGIGGLFFRSKNPKEAREWYGKNLGLAVNDYGSPFEFRNANRPEEINYLKLNYGNQLIVFLLRWEEKLLSNSL